MSTTPTLRKRYGVILDGIHERFRTVVGLESATFLKYEPSTIQRSPAMYSLLTDYERSISMQVVTEGYRILHRLLVKWTDNERAEEELTSYVNSIPLALEKDPKLNGRLSRGNTRIVRAKAGFTRIDGTTYRILDFTSETVDLSPSEIGT